MPILLICTKIDLRYDEETIKELMRHKQKPVTYEEGYAAAEEIEAFAYMECSAKLVEGVREVFVAAARASLLSQKDLRALKSKSLSLKHKTLKIGGEVAENRTPRRFGKLLRN